MQRTTGSYSSIDTTPSNYVISDVTWSDSSTTFHLERCTFTVISRNIASCETLIAVVKPQIPIEPWLVPTFLTYSLIMVHVMWLHCLRKPTYYSLIYNKIVSNSQLRVASLLYTGAKPNLFNKRFLSHAWKEFIKLMQSTSILNRESQIC